MNDIVGESSTGKRDLENPLSALTPLDYEEQGVVELDDDQFLVEGLVGKRVRRFRRRKVVQYLVNWKGYPEEENTWADETDIHDGLVRDYESRNSSE